MAVPLLLLHPLGSDHEFWTPLREHFSDRDIIAPDIAGHGTARRLPVDAHIDMPVGQLVSEIEALHPGPVDVVGVSLGGLIAQRLAVTNPGMVRRLVLADTVTRYEEPMRRMWTERAEVARTAGTRALVGPTLGLWFTEPFARAAGPVVQRTQRTLEDMPDEAYARACELLRAVDLTADLARIAAPTLVLCGEQDGPAFVEAAPRLSDAIPHATLAWLPGAHAAAIERPADFARVVRAFLDDTTPGSAQGVTT